MTTYHVTGKLAYSKRQFPRIVTTNLMHAMGINLWSGTVWQVNPDGTRKAIRRV